MSRVLFVLCATLFGLSPGMLSSAAAQTPPGLLYEGRLTYDGDVDPVEGEVVMTFGVFLEAEGGIALWSSTLPVEVVAGDFVVELGAVVPMPARLFDAGPRFVGVTVGEGDAAEELLPRQMIGAAPFALAAAQAGGLSDAALADLGTRMVDAPEFQALREAVTPPAPTLEDVTGGILTSELVVQAAATGLPLGFGARGVPEASVTLEVPDRGVLETIEITLDIGHPLATQLVVTLATPWGEVVSLHDRGRGDLAWLVRTYPIPGAPGRPLEGRYTLRATDRVEDRNTGTVRAFTVRATVRSAEQVSSAGRLAVGGALLAGASGAGQIGDVLHSMGNSAPAWARVAPSELSATGCAAGYALKVRADGLGWECATLLPRNYFGSTVSEVDVEAPAFESSISMVVGADGRPFIVYFASSGDLRVLKCGNARCSAGNQTTTVDSLIFPFRRRLCSVAIGPDGLPVVAYLDEANADLKILKCGNAECSDRNTTTTVDSLGSVGAEASIAVGPDGRPVVSYYDIANHDLKVLKCGNAGCTAGNTSVTVDSAGDVGAYTSIGFVQGSVAVSYLDVQNMDLKYVRCGNAACSAGNSITTLDAVGDTGLNSTLMTNESGTATIAYRSAAGAVKVIRCADLDCLHDRSTATIETLENLTSLSAVYVRNGEAANLPMVSYVDSVRVLKLASCGDDRCSPESVNILSRVISSAEGLLSASALGVGADNLPVIAYVTAGHVRVAHCSNPYCIDLNFGQ